MMAKAGRTTFIRASMGRIFRENLWLTVHCELGKRDLIVRGLTSGDVRFGSEADVCDAQAHVSLSPESDIKYDISECPLWANSIHEWHVHFTSVCHCSAMSFDDRQLAQCHVRPESTHRCHPEVVGFF